MGGVCLTSGAEEPLPQTHPRILGLQRETEGMPTTTHPVAGVTARETSGQQKDSAEKTIRQSKSKNFCSICSGPIVNTTS